MFLQVLEHQRVITGTRVAGSTAAQRQLAGPLIGREMIGCRRAVACRTCVAETLLALRPETFDVARQFGGIHPTFDTCLNRYEKPTQI